MGKNGKDWLNNSPDYEMSQIGIDIKTAGTGDKCKTGDWATIAWTGALTNGNIVTSSADEADGKPKTFTVGGAEVFKCWDNALPELKEGTKATIKCPSNQVWGSLETTSPIGNDQIPKNSDITFEIEVIHCNISPYIAPVEVQPVTSTLQPDRCFVFHSDQSSEVDYVLATEETSNGSWRNGIVEQYVKDDAEQ